jgi:AcrR family transcriptional regulator
MATPRREELLQRAYEYVLENGLSDLSLRPLARAIGSSPRVLLFLFESKEGLVRELLATAREEELRFLAEVRPQDGLDAVVAATWSWLVDPEHRGLLTLWLEVYARSVGDLDGPWRDFARQTVDDWLSIFAAAQPPARRRTKTGLAERTLALAVLRGALLDLLATHDVARTTAAVSAVSLAPPRSPRSRS